MMPLPITDTEIGLFSEYIQSVCGIQIDISKKYLIETRLDDLVKVYGSYTKLWEAARKDNSKVIEKKVISAISTNETFFFRDVKTFDLLRYKIVPEHFQTPTSKAISIWSAASSTGQEAYSISMVLKEMLLYLSAYRCKIYGTDISSDVINYANKAEYTKYEIDRGLTQKQIDSYFTKTGECYKIKDELRSICRFQADNLLNPHTLNDTFDIIFCRNVLIYFSHQDRQKIYSTLNDRLKKTGILILGASETLSNETPFFKREEYRGAIYHVKL
jgi:chemotaxis protein methyltransferase CheR